MKTKKSQPHPDPCWMISDPENMNMAPWATNRSLLVFSDEEKARTFLKSWPAVNHQLKEYSWDELVDKFGSRYPRVMVDFKNEPGLYSIIPLQKGI